MQCLPPPLIFFPLHTTLRLQGPCNGMKQMHPGRLFNPAVETGGTGGGHAEVDAVGGVVGGGACSAAAARVPCCLLDGCAGAASSRSAIRN